MRLVVGAECEVTLRAGVLIRGLGTAVGPVDGDGVVAESGIDGDETTGAETEVETELVTDPDSAFRAETAGPSLTTIAMTATAGVTAAAIAATEVLRTARDLCFMPIPLLRGLIDAQES